MSLRALRTRKIWDGVSTHTKQLDMEQTSSITCYLKRVSERRSELFCPKEFHNYSGVGVCLLFCRKKVCFVFKSLEKSSPIFGED